MEEFLLYTLSISLFVLLLAFKLFSQTTKPHKKTPPSPPSLPIIGHLYLLRAPLHRALRRLSDKHGGVLSLRFGYRGVVVLSSLSAVEECFTKNDVVLANRPRLITSKHLGYNNTTVATAPYGDHWRNLRRIGAIEIFSASRLKTFAGIRRDEVRRLLVKLLGNSISHPPDGGAKGFGFARVELKSMLSDMTFNIIMRMVAGKRYYGDEVSVEGEARRFRRIMKEAIASAGMANAADFLPLLKRFGGRRRLAERTDAFLQGLIDEHRGSRHESRNSTMIDHLLSLQQSQPDYYTDQIIKGFILVSTCRFIFSFFFLVLFVC